MSPPPLDSPLLLMENKQTHGSIHLSLSNSIPRNLINLRFSSCKHPKTASFSLPNEDNSADRHFSNSFSSLALDSDSFSSSLPQSPHSDTNGPIIPPSNRFFVSPSTSSSLTADICVHRDELAIIPPSDRFFISTSTSASLTDQTAQAVATSANRGLAKSPCTSSSLASDSTYTTATHEEATSSSSTSSHDVAMLDGVAVSTYSKDPYEDFRTSMQEMMDACHVDKSRPLDWDYMEDLLFCYLELNERDAHPYIIKAFTDTVAGKKVKMTSFSGD